jgi:hypothetical protein
MQQYIKIFTHLTNGYISTVIVHTVESSPTFYFLSADYTNVYFIINFHLKTIHINYNLSLKFDLILNS